MYATLNISATGIKLLSVQGRNVQKWGEAPLEVGLVSDGLVLQPEAVGQSIDALFKSTKVQKSNVIVSLTGLSFTHRTLSLPKMKPSQLEEAILRGAGKEIPLLLEELYPMVPRISHKRYLLQKRLPHTIDTRLQLLLKEPPPLAQVPRPQLLRTPYSCSNTSVRTSGSSSVPFHRTRRVFQAFPLVRAVPPLQ